MKDEGVIKFNCNWVQGNLPDAALINALNEWRSRLYEKKLIGVTPDDIGYGNMSIRFRENQFIITGSTTGKIEKLSPQHYTLVTAYNINQNSLTTIGPIKASSESLTHAMIYECCKDANAVFHVHHKDLWEKLLLILPFTRTEVPYGTPQMAKEIERLFKKENLAHHKIFAMGGHEEGVVSFGNTLDEAGQILEDHLRNL
jgi:L-ribulose-5-phosphate 4-epimerase